jgi:hypothetical protein
LVDAESSLMTDSGLRNSAIFIARGTYP